MKRVMKRAWSLLLAVVMVISAFAVVPISAGAASSKTLYCNADLLKKVGKQISGGYACACYALAYSRTMLDGKVHYYYEYNKGIKDEYNISCQWGAGNYYTVRAGSRANAFKACYDSINNNRPIILHVNSSYGQHWVTVVGYQNVSSTSSMTESNLLVIDPVKGYTGSPKTLSGYTLHSDYRYATTNSGSVAKPGASKITASKTEAFIYEKITFNWTAAKNATSYSLKYRNSNHEYTNTGNTTSLSKSLSFAKADTYYVYVDSIGADGAVKPSNVISIVVKKPTVGASTITASKKEAYAGQSVKFSWTAAKNAVSYSLKYRNSNHQYTKIPDTSSLSKSISFNKADTYYVYVDSIGADGSFKASNVIPIKVTAHSHTYAAATCTQPKTCKVCDATSGKALGHKYTNSCDTKCNVCGAARTITHSYKTTTTKATLSKNGSIVKKCTVCGKVASNTIKYAKTFKLSATNYSYNGTVRTPSVTVKDTAGKTLKKGTDYTVTYASGRKNVGTYKVTVKMKDNYSGSKTLTFKINPIKSTSCSIKLSASSYTYNGKVKTPSVVVKNARGTKLTKDKHYTVTYASGRKNVGTYKVTVKMKGNYSGSKTLTFKIIPKAASVNKLTAKSKAITVKLNRSLQQSTGYQVQYSTSKNFKNAKLKVITNYKTSNTTITGLKAKKVYYVRVRTYKTVGKQKIYSNWSSYKYVKTK